MKSIETLLEDIDNVFTSAHPKVVNDDALEECLDSIREALRTAVEESGQSRDFRLRASNLGKPDRQLFLDSQNPNHGICSPNLHRIFLTGHVMEAILIFLIKEAGHTVEDEQAVVTRDGIQGHQDCRIDGVPIDIKTASSASYTKFVKDKLIDNDPYGYYQQLAFYAQDSDSRAGWLVMDKQRSSLFLKLVQELELPNASTRIEEARELLAKDELPEPCFEPIEHDNGNIEIPKGCGFCEYREKCWPDVRAYKYATGIKRFTHVEKEPRVPEITKKKD